MDDLYNKAAELNQLADVAAVVDDGGRPIRLTRIDNVVDVASAEFAPGKARTAACSRSQ